MKGAAAMSDGRVTVRASVLHAALLLPTFSVERVARFTGLEPSDVCRALEAASELIEEVPLVLIDAHSPPLFRLVASMRQAVCLEVVQAIARSRGESPPDSRAVLRSIEVVLNAAESSFEEAHCQTVEGVASLDWLSRAAKQTVLAHRLLRLVPEVALRAPLNLRLEALRERLDLEAAGESSATSCRVVL
jgi:hypothetical protein